MTHHRPAAPEQGRDLAEVYRYQHGETDRMRAHDGEASGVIPQGADPGVWWMLAFSQEPPPPSARGSVSGTSGRAGGLSDQDFQDMTDEQRRQEQQRRAQPESTPPEDGSSQNKHPGTGTFLRNGQSGRSVR
jgi:hypothetical protein